MSMKDKELVNILNGVCRDMVKKIEDKGYSVGFTLNVLVQTGQNIGVEGAFVTNQDAETSKAMLVECLSEIDKISGGSTPRRDIN